MESARQKKFALGGDSGRRTNCVLVSEICFESPTPDRLPPMTATTTLDFIELVQKSGLVSAAQIEEQFGSRVPSDPAQCATALVKAELLSQYQAKQLLAGKFRGFLLGPYKIIRPIGQGGMGAVYLAEHTSLSRKVAIKVLTAEKAKDKLTLERFHREARSAAALDHPNIVRLHDISQGNGVHFLVMEYVEGNDLHSLMGQTGPLHFAQAAQYVAQAAAGLQHAHDKGFIHRDIKPANLMLTKDGSIKILDMGLARSFVGNSNDNLTALLAEGDIAGTVDFLSPEQAMNHPLDERSDLYSLGATFYSLLTGHPPFNGSTAQKLMQHQLKDPPSLTKKLNGRVPPALSEVIGKMMAKKPSERYQSATDIIDALSPWLPARSTGNIVQDGFSTSEIRVDSRTRIVKKKTKAPIGEPQPFWKKPAVLIGGAVGLLFLFAGIVAALAFGGSTPDATKFAGGPIPTNAQPSRPNPTPTQPMRTPTSVRTKPIVAYDFKNAKPASMAIDLDQVTLGKSNIEGVAFDHRVHINHWNTKASAEYSLERVNGDMAVCMKSTNNVWGTQINVLFEDSLPNLKPNDEYIVRLTYSYDGLLPYFAACEINEDPYPKTSIIKLEATNSQWKTVDIRYRKPQTAAKSVLVVGNGLYQSDETGDGKLSIKSIEVVLPGIPKPSEAGFGGRLLAVYDTATLPEFSTTEESFDIAKLNKDWNGWSTNTFDRQNVSNYRCVKEAGGNVLLVSNTGSQNASQFTFQPMQLAKAIIEEGPTYTAKLTYRTEGPGGGYASVQTILDWKTIGGLTLSGTSGEWKTVTYEFTRPVGKNIQLTFGPSNADGKALAIKQLEIYGPGSAAGLVLDRLDLTEAKPFSVRGTSEVTNDPAEDLRLVVRSKSGEGTWPKGWRGHPWDLSGDSEYGVEMVDGKKAMTVRNHEKNTAMLFSPRMQFPAGPIGVKMVWRADASVGRAVVVKFKQTAPTAERAFYIIGEKEFDAATGRWETKEFEANLKGATEGYFEIHYQSVTAPLAIAEFELSTGIAGVPNSVQEAPLAVGDSLKVFDFATTVPGKQVLERDGTARNFQKLPTDFGAWTYLKDSVAEFRVQSVEDSNAVGATNLNDPISAQLAFNLRGAVLKDQAKYIIRVSYLTTNDAEGKLFVQTDATYERFKHRVLPSTKGKWVERDLEFTYLSKEGMTAIVENTSIGEGNTLYVRKLEVFALPK